MNTLFYNGKVLTFGSSVKVIENGAVIVRGNTVEFAGSMNDSAYSACREGTAFDREIDLNGNLIMPGFKNCHTHSAMTIFRSAADDLKLDEWLNNTIFPREALFTPEDIYYATILAFMEYLTGGITEVCEMYIDSDAVAKAAADTGFRTVQCGALNSFSESIDLLRSWYEKYNGDDGINSFRFGIHAEYTCSKELLQEVSKLIHEYRAPLYLHVAETEKEVKDCMERNSGQTPVEYLDSLGLLDFGGVFFHGVHVKESDMDIIKKRNIAVITNPGSNTKLASGIAPVCDYIKKGISLGIGTDGAGSNNCLDMFREMFLMTGLAKLKENDASVMDAAEVLRIACSEGARVIGTKETDSLVPGKKADLIVIDLHSPNMQPENNIVKNIVYSGSKLNVKLTMIDGIIRYEDGKFNTGFDPEDIYREVNKTVKRIESAL